MACLGRRPGNDGRTRDVLSLLKCAVQLLRAEMLSKGRSRTSDRQYLHFYGRPRSARRAPDQYVSRCSRPETGVADCNKSLCQNTSKAGERRQTCKKTDDNTEHESADPSMPGTRPRSSCNQSIVETAPPRTG
eukprot:6192687-Pleurochrysis_carterae.AAC.2